MGYGRMQRVCDGVFVVLLLGLAGYLYHEAPQHPVVVLDQKPPLVVAQPVAGPQIGKGPNLAETVANFADTRWRADNVALQPNAATAPDQTKSAFRLAETSRDDRHRIETSIDGITPGQGYTLWLYVKPAERSRIGFEMRDGKIGKYGFAIFDVAHKAAITESGDVSDSGIEELPDGWFRCWATMPYATNQAVFNFALITAGRVSYWGSSGSGLFIWGVHFEPDAT
jgi:hypothetical protein